MTEILIIDDDGTTRNILRMLLEFEGFVVHDCDGGAPAFDLIRNNCFDVMLIDYKMPEMNGDEVVRRMRACCPSALIIGFSLESRDREFLAAGADAFVGKDAVVHSLVPVIRSLQR